MKIYIVRHGQTNSNLRRSCIGHKDVLLNETGEEQAKELAKKLSGIDFDVVYTSPLSRAVNTIMPTMNIKKDIKLVMNYGLIERDFGIMDDMTFDEIKAKYPDEYEAWMKDKISYCPPDGESVVDVFFRASETMDKIINSHQDSDILIVTHYATAKTIIAHLLGLPAQHSQIFYLDNACITVIKYENGKGMLTALNI